MKFMLFVMMLVATTSFAKTDLQPDPIVTKVHVGPNLDFNLVNMTGYTIRDIYVSPTKEKNWGEDIMERDMLGDGETVEISFAPGETDHLWDIYVTWDGYESDEDVFWIGLDLSTISEISLYYDHETGKTWAKTR